MLKALIIANCAIFVLQLLFSGRGFTELIWLSSRNLKQFELWRLGTHMFAHGGITHLLFNMWGLYIFGKPLEQRLGGNRFLHIYFMSGLIGAATWLLFNWNNPAPMLGASGAVFGIMAAAAMSFPNLQYMLLIPPIPMKLKTLAVVFGAIEVILLLQRTAQHQVGGVARLAHLGGMLGGFIYIYWIYPSSRRRYKRRNSLSIPLKQKLRRYFMQSRFRVKNPPRDNDKRNEPGNEVSSAEVDRILDKIGESGLVSLTQRERRILEKARERLKGKH